MPMGDELAQIVADMEAKRQGETNTNLTNEGHAGVSPSVSSEIDTAGTDPVCPQKRSKAGVVALTALAVVGLVVAGCLGAALLAFCFPVIHGAFNQ